jgi:hypothetical protein
MNKHAIGTVVGAILVGLGLLWTLQGGDVVHVRPVLCVSNCKPITGGSTGWLVIGLLAILAGIALIVANARHFARH